MNESPHAPPHPPGNDPVQQELVSRPPSPNQRAWRRLRRHRPAMVSAVFLVVVVVSAVMGPWLSPYDASANGEMQFAHPCAAHWLGTDVHGRDLLTRLLVGTRISLLVGAVGAGVSLVIGVFWGMVAAYVGGRTDNLMMRAVDILYSLPSIIFVMLMITLVEGRLLRWLQGWETDVTAFLRLGLLCASIGAVAWLNMARIVRGQVLSLKNRQFVLASLALGSGHRRILWHHILPNILGVVIVYVTLTVPAVILYESFLSFLGLGIRPPQASLGTLIADGAAQLNPIRIRWWLLVFPGTLLALLLLGLNFLGDGLRDALDPKADRE